MAKPVSVSQYTVVDLVNDSWHIAEEKGFHEGRDSGRSCTLLRLCLVHTEVSEAAQVVKRKWPEVVSEFSDVRKALEAREELAEELADAMIRIGDLAFCCGIDGGQLARAIMAKHHKNLSRPKYYGTPKEVAK